MRCGLIGLVLGVLLMVTSSSPLWTIYLRQNLAPIVIHVLVECCVSSQDHLPRGHLHKVVYVLVECCMFSQGHLPKAVHVLVKCYVSSEGHLPKAKPCIYYDTRAN